MYDSYTYGTQTDLTETSNGNNMCMTATHMVNFAQSLHSGTTITVGGNNAVSNHCFKHTVIRVHDDNKIKKKYIINSDTFFQESTITRLLQSTIYGLTTMYYI